MGSMAGAGRRQGLSWMSIAAFGSRHLDSADLIFNVTGRDDPVRNFMDQGGVMHLPDGFLSVSVWVPAWVLSLGGVGYSIRKATQTLKDRTVPLMGVMSAFIFAAQMVNFPVIGGTSGHLLGGVLAAVMLGPYAGAIVLVCVLLVQCLIFQDGGLTALGANVLNMALAGPMGGYLVYKIISGRSGRRWAVLAGTAVASWFSVVLAAAGCALQLALSGTSPLAVVLPAMVGIHGVIGVGEAVMTTLMIGFVMNVRPDLLYGLSSRPTGHAPDPLLSAESVNEASS
jgi:cobalt/nickel transport system permease protein